jgi:pretoxin HINT domain-containing protein
LFRFKLSLVGVAASLGPVLLCVISTALAAPAKKPAAAKSSPGQQSQADRLVRLAIEAEARADLDGRRQRLVDALDADENNPAAHWQSGQVFYQGAWRSLDGAAQQADRDKLLADYREMRTHFGDSAEAQRVLIAWCQKNQLAETARAHAARLHKLQPDDPEALKILGLSRYQGMLLTHDEIVRRKHDGEHARQALRRWQPRLLEIRRQIDSDDEAKSAVGWQALRAIDDPSAIAALETVFSKHRHDASLEVLKVIGRIDGAAATDSLLRHAFYSKWDDVRLAACQQLHRRAPIGYVPKLIAALTTPVEARIEIFCERDQIRFREVFEHQETTRVRQKVVETDVPLYIRNPNLGNIVNAAAMETMVHAQATAAIVNGSQRLNRHRQALNEEIYRVLEKSTGQELAHDPDAWYVWWLQNNYMPIDPKQIETETCARYVDVPYVPPPSHACFALGTQVWSLDGPLPIERVQVGDQVLAQDPASGELTFKPVLETTVGHATLIAIDVGGETVEATPGHVFWVSGSGWRMAAELKPGDRLHTVDGWAEIVGLKDIDAADTRNLIVADYGTYFVGDRRLLVHDVTMIEPYAGKVPGDSPLADLAGK